MRKAVAIAILFLLLVSTGLAHKKPGHGPGQRSTTVSASPSPIGGYWSFGNIAVFDLATEYDTVINSGTAPLDITMICVTNSTPEVNFTLSGQYTNQPLFPAASCIDPTNSAKFNFTIGPGKSEQLGVAFAPQSPGCKYATLEIYGNFDSNPQTISLFGNGFDSWPPPNC
jgi:hypothetical protein